MRRFTFALVAGLVVVAGLQVQAKPHKPAGHSHKAEIKKAAPVPASYIQRAPWGEVDGQKVDIYTLTNKNGMSARITNYGAFLVSLNAPDRNGKMADVVLGYDTLKEYTTGTTYGAVIGRFANRSVGAQFTLDGKTYHLKANAGPNNIHGGP